MSSSLTVAELINTEVLRSKGTYFRNRDIVDATGASRSHVSQQLKKLWDDGIIERHGIDWTIVDQARLMTILMRQSRHLALENAKLLKPNPQALENLAEGLTLLQGMPSDWEAVSHRLEEYLLDDINTALETLRNFKRLLTHPQKSRQQVFMHMVNSGEYSEALQSAFVQAVKYYLGEELDNVEVITEVIRPVAREKYGS